jgi:hypothetical protein
MKFMVDEQNFTLFLVSTGSMIAGLAGNIQNRKSDLHLSNVRYYHPMEFCSCCCSDGARVTCHKFPV